MIHSTTFIMKFAIKYDEFVSQILTFLDHSTRISINRFVSKWILKYWSFTFQTTVLFSFNASLRPRLSISRIVRKDILFLRYFSFFVEFDTQKSNHHDIRNLLFILSFAFVFLIIFIFEDNGDLQNNLPCFHVLSLTEKNNSYRWHNSFLNSN